MRAPEPRQAVILPRLTRADRKSLLLGTALASTLLIGALVTPTPASAVVNCPAGTGPAPISYLAVADFIICVNTEARTNAAGNAISLQTLGNNYYIDLYNSGVLTATAFGIITGTNGDNSPIAIVNLGGITTTAVAVAAGIDASTLDTNSPIDIVNSANVTVSGAIFVYGINADTSDANSPIAIVNSGDIMVIVDGLGYGIDAGTRGDSPLSIVNSGDIAVVSTGGLRVYGIEAVTFAPFEDNSPLSIVNSGDIALTAAGSGFGISGSTSVGNSPLSIVNSGNIAVAAANFGFGITASTSVDNSPLSIVNSGDFAVTGAAGFGTGIRAYTFDPNSPLSIVNSGNFAITGVIARGFHAYTRDDNSPIDIVNSGKITASGSFSSYGIDARADGANSPISIINSGDISAASLFAIQADGGATSIFNTGLITGFVDLTDNGDTFINQQDGVFEARLTSYFGMSDDRFRNEQGGLVHTAADPTTAEFTSFVALERFENKGLISLADGKEDDVFQISNTLGGTDLAFAASGASTLLVDAFLGPPGSTADNFIIDGDVTGKTALAVNNTNPGPGVFNPQGIPVVLVPNGEVKSDAFFLPQPINTGLFDWDLYFVPTGSGFFELRSFPGGGAHVLPQLLTAAQDLFHTTNETWFDRTADLRVLLNGGAAYGAGGGKLGDGAPAAFTPGVWLKGSGTWLEQEDSAKTSAYGRTYRYNLNRDLDVANFEGGIDFGKKGVWAEGDALVFGVLGGVVLGTLDYDQLIRQFDIEGGEVGGYATYLSGGLFVDTLVKVDFLEFDTQGAPGLPGTLDATTWGFRTDAGYKFGGFRRGPFIEPLATIAVAWSEIDDFSLGGNSVKFDDEANVRGRLGLRVGTSREVWSGIVMEPFVIGSVWGHLSGDNKVTVTSTGTTFRLEDEPDDVWGVASAGVNFFSPGASTSLFAKLDVTFGEETEGVSAKGGMRYNW